MIDLFPPTPQRNPFGLHKIVWDEIEEKEFDLPTGKDRILASYETGDVQACYVEAIGVGDALPDMPLFLANSWHVPVPLELTYQATWNACPEELRLAVETGFCQNPMPSKSRIARGLSVQWMSSLPRHESAQLAWLVPALQCPTRTG